MPEALERKLYVIRKRATDAKPRSICSKTASCSMSAASRRDAGLQGPADLDTRFRSSIPTFATREFKTALAMVHQRFSTNTFPSWDRAHPYRFLSHNGEINTLRGNINWMRARGRTVRLAAVRRRHQEASADRRARRQRLGHVRQLPRAAGAHRTLAAARRDDDDSRGVAERRADEREQARFYEFHSCMMEPWDGPASIAFTDGASIGAVLDRNGLRPSRYLVTKDGLVVMASEAGVLDIPPEQVARKGRLQPGRMFLVDTVEGRIVQDEEIKERWRRASRIASGSTRTWSISTQLPEPPARPRFRSRPTSCSSSSRRSATRSRI